jgi:hypothetical protein
MNNMGNFYLFFSRLFASYILNNEIVATILHVCGKKLSTIDSKVDVVLNDDI